MTESSTRDHYYLPLEFARCRGLFDFPRWREWYRLETSRQINPESSKCADPHAICGACRETIVSPPSNPVVRAISRTVKPVDVYRTTTTSTVDTVYHKECHLLAQKALNVMFSIVSGDTGSWKEVPETDKYKSTMCALSLRAPRQALFCGLRTGGRALTTPDGKLDEASATHYNCIDRTFIQATLVSLSKTGSDWLSKVEEECETMDKKTLCSSCARVNWAAIEPRSGYRVRSGTARQSSPEELHDAPDRADTWVEWECLLDEATRLGLYDPGTKQPREPTLDFETVFGTFLAAHST